MIAGGFLLYKCRLCGELSDGAHTPDVFHTILCLANGYELPETWAGREMATTTTTHSCRDGCLGIADIVGGKGDKE